MQVLDLVDPPVCLARCCEAFHVSGEMLEWLRDEPENVRDGHFIRDMLVELTPETAQETHHGWGLVGWNPEPGERYFTCNHWDPASRLCTVYADRPQMCRDHPCGVCQFGCGVVN